MAEHCFIKVLEDSGVSPPPGSVPTTSLPLTFFDTTWITCRHMKRLFLYEFPYPPSHFIQNALPDLRTSLSLALQQFFPFAGHLRLPHPPQRPYIYYENGDSVPFLVAESTAPAEFNHLIRRDHVPLRVDELKSFVPELPPPPPTNGNGACKQQPLMAIQVTIFPNAGVSLGVTFSHVAADGRAFAHFTKSWAAICKSKGDSSSAFFNSSPPDYRRDLIQDPHGIWSIFLKQRNEAKKRSTGMSISPTDNVRFSPVFTKSHVETLKKRIALKFTEENEKDEPRLSTFVVTIAFIWVCLIKLHRSNNQTVDDHGTYVLLFQADCRDRLRLPANYFGNCLKPCTATVKTSEIAAENGVLVAAKAIGNAIKEFEKEPLKGAESWISRSREVSNGCEYRVAIAGSPKLRVYDTDFGFGRPIKSDVVHITSRSSISMAETRDEEGGVELGLALPLADVEKFNAILEQGLLNLS
ncbi:hypothetical protein like AT1G03940 [Hibiscus trionum]|uniref:Uncharacterized protein n=1 Tax=Hibiscus trionum TaxID=183268 RepID=A0A9W7HJS5_HIBTR|nr:hypothetical protein like AT1G03940 [Hibiscus trionum]